MTIPNLPTEIQIQILKHLDDQRDINSFCRTNRELYYIFNDYLYHFNIRSHSGSAILWAAENGNESTARRFLHLGVSGNIVFRGSMSDLACSTIARERSTTHLGITPLHMAVWKSQRRLVQLFLDVGADPGAPMPNGWTPLGLALISRNEKIVRTISWYISDLHSHLVDVEKQLSPLHMASLLRLPNSVRFFLQNGVDINIRDSHQNTPLHHALATSYQQLGYESGTYAAPLLDQTFQTVTELLRSGADTSLEGFASMTIAELGERHQEEQVRKLFGVTTKYSAPQRPKSGLVHIGRSWMSSEQQLGEVQKVMNSELTRLEYQISSFIKPNQVDRESIIRTSHRRYSSDSRSGETSFRMEDSNQNAFPVLGGFSTLTVPNRHLRICGSRWFESETKLLIASFVSAESESPPTAQPAERPDPFPQLVNKPGRICNEISKDKWESFRQSEALTPCSSMLVKSETEASVLLSRTAKKKSKGRWQPLTL